MCPSPNEVPDVATAVRTPARWQAMTSVYPSTMTAWRRCAAVAHAYDVAMGHHEEPQVAVHLIASQSHGTYAECFHPDRDPIWWRMIANRPEVVEGRVALPTGPGFGWELDRDFIEHYRVAG